MVGYVSIVVYSAASSKSFDHTSHRFLFFCLFQASDVWSLGCILYQMCYGKTPFADIPNMIAKLQAIIDPSHEIKFPETIPTSAIDAIRSCLKRIPEERSPIVGENGLLNQHRFLNHLD